MTSVTRGILPLLALNLLLVCVLFVPACIGTTGGGSPPAFTLPVRTTATPPPATGTVRTQAAPPATPMDLSQPPPRATPVIVPVDPIVGKWYAPPPDDITFEFYGTGTFVERSPNFATYWGTWKRSAEGEADFYDATILDRWGFRKEAHLYVATGTLWTKSIGTFHRVE